MTLYIADTNEFHPLINGQAYKVFSPVVILRATYSNYHVDNKLASSLNQAQNLASIGFYAYVTASEDAGSQGTFFAQTLQRLWNMKPTDFIAWDIEEGSGDQSGRAQAFLDAVHAVLHEQLSQDFGYSGASFWSTHLGAVRDVHRWIASYGSGDPAMSETLWQFSDNYNVPGVSGLCDVSIFNSTLQQFLSLIGSAPAPVVTEDDDSMWIFACSGQPTIVVVGGLTLNVPDDTDLQALEAQGAKIVRVDVAFSQELQKKL